MAKKETRRKTASFGGATLDHIRPEPDFQSGQKKALNLVLSFEEALKLHLSLGQALGHINGYNRATAEGKRKAVNLFVQTDTSRIVVREGEMKKK
ncbi:MAG: hypothetical protein ACF8PN_07610 [Phycisphaerales bacterium]